MGKTVSTLMILLVIFCNFQHSAESLAVDTSIKRNVTLLCTEISEVDTTSKPNIAKPCKVEENPSKDPCYLCQCDEISGAWSCEGCISPICVDGYKPPGQCCQVCPNGENCRIEGEIVSFGQSHLMRNGDICVCSETTQDVFMCHTPTTTSATTLSSELLPLPSNTEILKSNCEGKVKSMLDPCAHCECENHSGDWEWTCWLPACSETPCVDPSTPPGQCCPVCPNGPNCLIDGKIVSFNQSYVMNNGETCRCISGDNNYRYDNFSCLPATTTTLTSTTSTTTEWQYEYAEYADCDQNDPVLKDPCNYCTCSGGPYGKSMWICCGRMCSRMPCVDEYKAPWECCSVCPNGPNCLINGYIVPEGYENVMENGDICSCLYSHGTEEPPEVYCVSPQDRGA